MNPLDLIDALTKSLLAIATIKVTDDPAEAITDLIAVKHEAANALGIAGYDVEIFDIPNTVANYLGTTGNAEA